MLLNTFQIPHRSLDKFFVVIKQFTPPDRMDFLETTNVTRRCHKSNTLDFTFFLESVKMAQIDGKRLRNVKKVHNSAAERVGGILNSCLSLPPRHPPNV